MEKIVDFATTRRPSRRRRTGNPFREEEDEEVLNNAVAEEELLLAEEAENNNNRRKDKSHGKSIKLNTMLIDGSHTPRIEGSRRKTFVNNAVVKPEDFQVGMITVNPRNGTKITNSPRNSMEVAISRHNTTKFTNSLHNATRVIGSPRSAMKIATSTRNAMKITSSLHNRRVIGSLNNGTRVIGRPYNVMIITGSPFNATSIVLSPKRLIGANMHQLRVREAVEEGSREGSTSHAIAESTEITFKGTTIKMIKTISSNLTQTPTIPEGTIKISATEVGEAVIEGRDVQEKEESRAVVVEVRVVVVAVEVRVVVAGKEGLCRGNIQRKTQQILKPNQ